MRSGAALWTSRNRVFVSSDPRRLATILALAERHERLLDPVEAEVVARIGSLVDEERREHGLGKVRLIAAA